MEGQGVQKLHMHLPQSGFWDGCGYNHLETLGHRKLSVGFWGASARQSLRAAAPRHHCPEIVWLLEATLGQLRRPALLIDCSGYQRCSFDPLRAIGPFEDGDASGESAESVLTSRWAELSFGVESSQSMRLFGYKGKERYWDFGGGSWGVD
jgi:hypothetical protein